MSRVAKTNRFLGGWILSALLIYCFCLDGQAYAQAKPEFVQWPPAPGSMNMDFKGLWRLNELHGKVKSVKTDAYTATVNELGELVKAMPEKREQVPEESYTQSLLGEYPFYEIKYEPSLEKYREDGKIVERISYDIKGKPNLVNKIAYDQQGRLLSETVQDKTQDNGDFVVFYGYDDKSGNLASIVREPYNQLSQPVYYEYDKSGRLVKVKSFCMVNNYSFINADYEQVKEDAFYLYNYGNDGRVLSISKKNMYGSEIFSYSYDDVKKTITKHLGETPTEDNKTFAMWQMDEAGRIVLVTDYYVFSPGKVNYYTTVYTRDDKGRVVKIAYKTRHGEQEWLSESHYKYDEKGNMIRYSFDQYGKKDTQVETYFYDAQGNWIFAAYSNKWREREVPEPVQPVVIERTIEYYH